MKLITKPQAIEALSLFCRKYEIVTSYSFVEAMRRFRVSKFHNIPNQTVDIYYDGPTDEQLDAVLLHFRFFIVRNERSAIWFFRDNMRIAGATTEELERAEVSYLELELWRETSARVQWFKKRDFLAALIYGERVHANEAEWVEQYSQVKRDQILGCLDTALTSELVFEFIVLLEPFFGLAKDYLRGARVTA